jgi:phosphatidate cytidylyltransferase
VPDADPADATASAPAGRSNLTLRVISSLVLAPLALLAAYWGGWPFALFWGIACVIVLCEWIKLVMNSLVAPPKSAGRLLWIVMGVAYAGAILVATLALRADSLLGFAVIVFVFAVVWMTDIAAYFTGRAFGGPKLMPSVSPKKTWSGAIGGTVAAIVAGVLVAHFAGIVGLAAVAAVALVLSAVSQAGDLLESAIKRHFDAKDSGTLLPGHGGLMDRLDGYATAVVAAALIGVLRGGFDAPARGLMVW